MKRRYPARLIALTLAVPGLLFPISFNTPRAFPLGIGNAGYSMVLGDFNADGVLDVAIAIVEPMKPAITSDSWRSSWARTAGILALVRLTSSLARRLKPPTA